MGLSKIRYFSTQPKKMYTQYPTIDVTMFEKMMPHFAEQFQQFAGKMENSEKPFKCGVGRSWKSRGGKFTLLRCLSLLSAAFYGVTRSEDIVATQVPVTWLVGIGEAEE